MKPIIAFIITFAIGITLSILYTFALQSGRLEKWHLMQSPPAEPNELVLGEFGELYIRTGDGKFFVCKNPNQQDCWVLSTPPPSSPEPNSYLSECRDHTFDVANPPFVVIRQVEWCGSIIEGLSQTIYSQSDNGEIWMWNHGSMAQAALFIILIGFCVSFVIGLLVALIIILYRRKSIRLREGT